MDSVRFGIVESVEHEPGQVYGRLGAEISTGGWEPKLTDIRSGNAGPGATDLIAPFQPIHQAAKPM